MNRKSFLKSSLLVSGSILLVQKNMVAQLLNIPDWKITMLTDEIGIFTERGGTIGFLLGTDGIYVVDAEFPEQATHLIGELKKKSTKPFNLLINSHHHGDHTAGNISFKGVTQRVLAHANSKANQERVAKEQKSEEKQLYPDKTYTDTWCESAGKEKICLYYYGPAHTDGDSVIHFENANIVHMGDLVFNRRHPFIDRTAGASARSWITVLDKTLKKFDSKTKYIFGHAAEGYDVTGTGEDLKKFKDYLEKLVAFTDSEIKAGKSKDEILKATIIPGAPEWNGDGIQRSLGAVYDELTAG